MEEKLKVKALEEEVLAKNIQIYTLMQDIRRLKKEIIVLVQVVKEAIKERDKLIKVLNCSSCGGTGRIFNSTVPPEECLCYLLRKEVSTYVQTNQKS